ncbi:MAG: AtpZ/AtpI family protein [Acidobacteria bacterium]|nr:AtpZ/AtpI family protein [Acidobacteriota bacterium]
MEGPQPATRDPSSKPGNKSNWAQVARYSHLAFVLPAATVVGWLLGAAMDSWLGTTWINRAGLVLGIVAGFLELVRGALRLKDEE